MLLYELKKLQRKSLISVRMNFISFSSVALREFFATSDGK